MAIGRVLACLLCLLFAIESVTYEHTIYISPSDKNAEDSEACLTSNSASTPCRTLTWVFMQTRSSSTHYVLTEETYSLTDRVPVFERLATLAVSGEAATGRPAVINCTSEGIGLAFINVVNITLSNVVFQKCGALQNSTSKNFTDKESTATQRFKVALYFYLCGSLNFSHVEVSHSNEATGVVIYDTNGTNTISSSTFYSNNVGRSNPGGGGVYVEFTYCEPGILNCNRPSSERNSGASFTFSSCTFESNHAGNLDSHDSFTYIVPYKSDHEAFGRGGGLSMIIKGATSNIKFSVQDCMFENNSALLGGGLYADLQDSAHGNMITVTGSTFIQNSCTYTIHHGLEGGGMRLGHFVYGLDSLPSPTATKNEILVENSQFTENYALHGGGVAISPSPQLAERDQMALIRVANCTFSRNIAKTGSAINIQKFKSIITGGLVADIRIEDSMFESNFISYVQHIGDYLTPHELGIGSVYVNEVSVWIKGDVVFNNNNGSALAVVSSTINFSNCSIQFTNNSGNRGGAIALLGTAYMLVDDDTWMLFDYNVATTRGGAIYNSYIGRENLESDRNCFIRHTDPFRHPDFWNSSLFFVYNYDQGGNNLNAIHSTSILPCLTPGGSGVTTPESKKEIFCWNGWYYTDHVTRCDAVSNKDASSEIGYINYMYDNIVKVYPGWAFALPVYLYDDLGREIHNVSFTVTYNDTNTVTVDQMESILVRGEPDMTIGVSFESLGERVWNFDMFVELKHCPPGFSVSADTDDPYNASAIVCKCSGLYGGAILCDDDSKIVQLLDGMWLGALEHGSYEYYVMDCPLHFCHRENHTTKYITFQYDNTGNYTDLNNVICGGNERTGINCGECLNGYGPAVNSLTYECVDCTDINLASNIAKYVASVYLPLATLFTVLIVFDIRLTTGPANAFILYCQVVTSTFDLNADGGLHVLSEASEKFNKAYRFPFGIFNLKFIENYIKPICFTSNKHFTTLSILMMDYAVAIFPLVMILVLIVWLKISESCCLKNERLSVESRRRFLSVSRLASVLSRRNKKKNLNDALLPGFASFLLLSYTKFSVTSAYILNLQHPINKDGEQIYPPRVYYAPQYSVNDRDYMFYRIPAIIVMTTIVIFLPLILLDYPLRVLEWLISRFNCLKRLYPMTKIHHFLNMFQGCYHGKMRFFAGLYFLFRFVINVSYIITDTWMQQFLVQQAATTLMITLLALCQPYERKFLNYVDILIFTNLAILNSISFYLYSFAKVTPNLTPPPSARICQYLLVFLPLFYMLGYFLWNVTRSCHPKMKQKFSLFVNRLKGKDGYEPLQEDDNEETSTASTSAIMGKPPRMSFVDKRDFEDDFEAMLSRAEDQNTYVPNLSVSVIEVSGRHTQGEASATPLSDYYSGNKHSSSSRHSSSSNGGGNDSGNPNTENFTIN